MRGTQQTTEQLVQSRAGQATALPIDFGSGADQLFLILYGSNAGGNANGAATFGGTPATLTYAGPLSPFNGVGQYNVATPRSLAGAGKVT
ncbi:MAG: hypothetical protein M3Z32_01410 [Acidobacteriota bacterium]|nr:hypothetical protein [Acidobacteriota bacterium]